MTSVIEANGSKCFWYRGNILLIHLLLFCQ